MGLQRFERRMERTVEDVFARAFKSKVKPIELGRRLVREMDSNRTVDVRGRTVVPNSFHFSLSSIDHEPFVHIHDALVRELKDVAQHHATDESYAFLGPVSIEISADDALRSGRFECHAEMFDSASLPVRAVLVCADGRRITLEGAPAILGRLPDCEVPLDDVNVSRRHAEVRLVDGAHQVTDLGSTNGTQVNGATVAHHRLSYGDVITVGASVLRYEAS
jgi:hypothetical protein